MRAKKTYFSVVDSTPSWLGMIAWLALVAAYAIIRLPAILAGARR